MDTFLQIDMRAAQIPDGVLKLKFLRRELNRPRETVVERLPVGSMLGAVFTALCLMATGSTAPARVTATPSPVTAKAAPAPVQRVSLTAPPASPEKIWLVEKLPAYWVYSNGLQIRTEYLTESTVRHYKTWSRATLAEDTGESTFPAGIVFHTTESLIIPLEPGQAHSLLRTREGVLDHIRRDHLYNYLIDRFGQVFRMVPDDEVAYHAGHSIWADQQNVYEGLNDSFLGVAFEASTYTSFVPNAAQVRSGRMLTDLLRSQFSIQASNCVTHAQVSVNPSNMQIGYHTDWAANFPFAEFGLPDGYATPLPAVEIFGFGYNHFFLEAIGGKPWTGLTAAEDYLRGAAEARKISPTAYRTLLQRNYQAIRQGIRSQKNEPAERDRT